MAEVGDLVEAAYQAWNERDSKAWDALTADDIEVAFSGGFSGTGIEAHRQYFQGWHSAFPDNKATIRSVVTQDDRAMVEGTFSGTHTGVLHTPAGDEIAPTDQKVNVDYTEALRFRDGKLTYHRTYFDQVELLTQLGLMPGG
jgi:ketosteroid isomerase-like protein